MAMTQAERRRLIARDEAIRATPDRDLYNQACHGAGAAVRSAARLELERRIAASGVEMAQFFAEEGWDLAAYFASRPI
jgi:hypothetical protein